MAKRRKGGKRKSPRKNPESHAARSRAGKKAARTRARHRKHNPSRGGHRRRRNPGMGGAGVAIFSALAGIVAGGALYTGLAFVPSSAGLNTNTVALIGAGVGIAGGVVLGMLGQPMAGVAVAAGCAGAAAAQFGSAEVVAYQAGIPNSPPATPAAAGINALSDQLPVHADNDLMSARSRLTSMRMR